MMLMGARAVVVDVVVERESLVIRVKGAVVVVDGVEVNWCLNKALALAPVSLSPHREDIGKLEIS